MEPFKNLYNDAFFGFFTQALREVYPTFDTSAFMDALYDEAWEGRELKQRMRHITECLHRQMPQDFGPATAVILACIEQLKHNGLKEHSVEYMFFPDYIECYGLEELNTSITAMEAITPFTSCEFAVRPFIIRYPKAMLAQMLAWSTHENHHVRRLASEGSRPRLPWAMALPALKQDPSPLFPILENLKNDTSEYVRRSVANNLNDIAKDHPEEVIATAKRWFGQTAETDWVVKHASRTLLKAGNAELMQLFGFGAINDIQIRDFTILTPNVTLGEEVVFSFSLENKASQVSKLRLEYGVYYQKANGTLSRKVFKISEKEYAANSVTEVERKQHFKPITTRVYHAGLHEVSLIVNGVELEKKPFEFAFPKD